MIKTEGVVRRKRRAGSVPVKASDVEPVRSGRILQAWRCEHMSKAIVAVDRMETEMFGIASAQHAWRARPWDPAKGSHQAGRA